MHKRLNILFALLFALAPVAAWAQYLPDPVQYVITPEVPGPGQQVTIEVQGIGAFVGDAAITWQRDGKVVQSGTGVRTYTFTTGALGSVTKIHIDIKSPTNGSFSKDLVFRPSVVDMVWEADTSAPPLFAGKPLYSAGSALKVVALPTVIINGARVSAPSLSYQWSRNGNALASQSGLGRNSVSFDGDQLQQEEDLDVGVYFGSSLVAHGSIAIPAASPQLVLYERDALRGLLTDAAMPANAALNAKEITLVAEPYYFSRAAAAGGALEYSWTLNGNDIVGPDSARGVLTLRQTGEAEGSAALEASVQNSASDQLVQSASAALKLLFGQSPGSLFGL